MTKEEVNTMDMRNKLSSRKFWLALIGFVTPLMVIVGFDDLSTAQMETLLLSLGTLVAYILGESYVDGKSLSQTAMEENTTQTTKEDMNG